MKTNEQLTAQNMLIEINRLKFAIKKIETDYSGSSRLEPYEKIDAGYTRLPLVFAPSYKDESPSVLLLPSFFERVVGWSVEESREWIKQFMYKNVLPHRFSIQWKKGDLCVFNNRRFMHSSTPALQPEITCHLKIAQNGYYYKRFCQRNARYSGLCHILLT